MTRGWTKPVSSISGTPLPATRRMKSTFSSVVGCRKPGSYRSVCRPSRGNTSAMRTDRVAVLESGAVNIGLQWARLRPNSGRHLTRRRGLETRLAADMVLVGCAASTQSRARATGRQDRRASRLHLCLEDADLLPGLLHVFGTVNGKH